MYGAFAQARVPALSRAVHGMRILVRHLKNTLCPGLPGRCCVCLGHHRPNHGRDPGSSDEAPRGHGAMVLAAGARMEKGDPVFLCTHNTA